MSKADYRLWRLGFDDAYHGVAPDDAPYPNHWYVAGRIEGEKPRQFHRFDVAKTLSAARHQRRGARRSASKRLARDAGRPKSDDRSLH